MNGEGTWKNPDIVWRVGKKGNVSGLSEERLERGVLEKDIGRVFRERHMDGFDKSMTTEV